jgi:hypothetical protein
MQLTLVQADITWGTALDTENANPDAQYLVVYHGPFGENLYTVYDQDISRYTPPDDICKITIESQRPDGSPDAGRVYEFSDEGLGTGNGEFVRRIVLNTHGRGVFFATPGSGLLTRQSGSLIAWNVVIPDLRTVAFTELIKTYGSPTDTDPRRAIGLS